MKRNDIILEDCSGEIGITHNGGAKFYPKRGTNNIYIKKLHKW